MTSTSTSVSMPSARVIIDALRVDLGLGLGELTLGDELGDEAVVVGELPELAVAQQVRAGVADVADHEHLVVAEHRGGERGAHAAQAGSPDARA